jgi:hypothetical protein
VTFTDSTGNYSIEVPAGEGLAYVCAQAVGHEEECWDIPAIECFGSYQQNFELYPDCDLVWVSGHVEDKMTGLFIEDAEVWAENCVDYATDFTDPDGWFGLELDFDPTCTTWVCAGRWQWVGPEMDDFALEYNISCDSVNIPKCSEALIDFQLHQTPKSRVLLYYGNGGWDDGTNYNELARFFAEEWGLIVDYTDQWPDEFDWTLKYKLIVMLGPGHDTFLRDGDETDLSTDGFTIGQKAFLDKYLQEQGWLVILSDATSYTGQGVENDLLGTLPVELLFNGGDFTSGFGDQLHTVTDLEQCLLTNVWTLSAIDAADNWTDVWSDPLLADPGDLVDQNAGSAEGPNETMYAADIPSHGNGLVLILGDLHGLSDATYGPGDFNWPGDNEWVAFNWIACDP